jgi:hypothetical protein
MFLSTYIFEQVWRQSKVTLILNGYWLAKKSVFARDKLLFKRVKRNCTIKNVCVYCKKKGNPLYWKHERNRFLSRLNHSEFYLFMWRSMDWSRTNVPANKEYLIFTVILVSKSLLLLVIYLFTFFRGINKICLFILRILEHSTDQYVKW